MVSMLTLSNSKDIAYTGRLILKDVTIDTVYQNVNSFKLSRDAMNWDLILKTMAKDAFLTSYQY